MSDTDKSELELRKILGEEDWLYSDKPSRIQALITQQCNQARIDESDMHLRYALLATKKDYLDNVKRRIVELQAQAKETEA
jgi:hypothetical protein